MYGYVYKLTNTLNNKVYVGQHKHKTFDQNYWGSGTYIARAINKHGTSVFKREILCWCRTKEELDKAEAEYINKSNCFYPEGYNITDGGFGGDTFSKLSEDDLLDIKKKMSKASKGKPKSESHRANMSKYMKQKAQDPEWREWFKTIGKKGCMVALKNKSYLKGAAARKGQGSWNKGKQMSNESRQKMKLNSARKGQHWYTNGKSNIMSFECPDGYFRGRIINH